MIHVLATLDLAPGTREAFLAEFRKIIPDVHAEAGCIEYGPAVDADSDLPNHYRVGPDRAELRWDENGIRYRIVLRKEDEEWRVDDIFIRPAPKDDDADKGSGNDSTIPDDF